MVKWVEREWGLGKLKCVPELVLRRGEATVGHEFEVLAVEVYSIYAMFQPRLQTQYRILIPTSDLLYFPSEFIDASHLCT